MRFLQLFLTTAFCLAAFYALVGCQSLSDGNQSSVEGYLPADTVTLSNGIVRLGVSPTLGKVVEFGFVDGENLIWVNGTETQAYLDDLGKPATQKRVYYKIGGDKLWPTVQMLWPETTGRDWPPDRVIDGSPWTLTAHDDSSLTIQSGVSSDYGIVVSRRFELLKGEARGRITNIFRRVSDSTAPLSLWSVTQVKRPLYTVLDIAHDRPPGGGMVSQFGNDMRKRKINHWDVIDGEIVVWRHTDQPNVKLATMGRWLAAVYDQVTFLQEGDFDPTGRYPDASSVQVFYPPSDFTELEILSPLQSPGVGETIQNTVVWSLVRVSARESIGQLLTLDNVELEERGTHSPQ